MAFFLSEAQPILNHTPARASQTRPVLNGRGPRHDLRAPRYFGSKAFNLARVPLLAIVAMIVGWIVLPLLPLPLSLYPLRVFSFRPPPRFYPVMHRPVSLSLSLYTYIYIRFFPFPLLVLFPSLLRRGRLSIGTKRFRQVERGSARERRARRGREIEGWNAIPPFIRCSPGERQVSKEIGPRSSNPIPFHFELAQLPGFRVNSMREKKEGIVRKVQDNCCYRPRQIERGNGGASNRFRGGGNRVWKPNDPCLTLSLSLSPC